MHYHNCVIMIKLLKDYYKLNTWLVFVFIILLYFLSLAIEFRFIFTDAFYLRYIEGTTQNGSVYDFIKADRATEWVNFPFAIIVVLVPSFLIAFILNVGVALKEYKIKFKSLFQVVVKAQLVFAVNYLISTILKWQGILENKYETINNNYAYQSVLFFFKSTELPFWSKYPLQILNFTELIHLFFLSFGFSIISQLGYLKALGFVLLFYGLALVFWIIITVFFQKVIYG